MSGNVGKTQAGRHIQPLDMKSESDYFAAETVHTAHKLNTGSVVGVSGGIPHLSGGTIHQHNYQT